MSGDSTVLRLRYRSLGISRDTAEPQLLGGLFLLAGEQMLEIGSIMLTVVWCYQPTNEKLGPKLML